MKTILRSGLAVAALLASQLATAVPLTFNFAPDSTVFRTTSCRTQSDLDLNGNGVRDALRLCGEGYPVTGVISGTWDGTRLTGLSGNIDGHAITGGSLGGAFYTADLKPLWTIITARWGTFVFEKLDGFNMIQETGLRLIGQNLAAYGIRERCQVPGRVGLNTCTTKGAEIYSGIVSVAEPAALVILLSGLAGGAVALRRRRAVTGLATA